MKIGVIGGGAAGFFGAIQAKKSFPKAHVVILEKSDKVLSKVKISGGGRCNVTNNCPDLTLLSRHYPRGEKFLRKVFGQFDAMDTIRWFEERGVALKTYPDNCVFPRANDSQVVIDCFQKEITQLKIEVITQFPCLKLLQKDNGFLVESREKSMHFDRILLTIGGQPKASGLHLMEELNIPSIAPVPSLFTFNMPGNPVVELMGNVMEKVTTKIEGTKLLGKGPLLITHWGMSGPAILQLSAWGARILEEKKYQFHVLVNWLDEAKEQDVLKLIQGVQKAHGDKKMSNYHPFPMTNRMWTFLREKTQISADLRWKELAGKSLNRLINTLMNDRYEVKGKTTFKEEFVTAGGIALSEINPKTMESKTVPGLFFAGEVMDVDGITGGFNFQAAWSTSYVAGSNIGSQPEV